MTTYDDLLLAMAIKLKDRLTGSHENVKLATAESLTGGLLASSIVSVPGASRYFVGSVVAYGLDQKVACLGVDRDMALECDCVSEEVVKQMAGGAEGLLEANVVIATTGYADGNRPYAWIDVLFFGEHHTKQYVPSPGTTRNEMRTKVAIEAFIMLSGLLQSDFQ